MSSHLSSHQIYHLTNGCIQISLLKRTISFTEEVDGEDDDDEEDDLDVEGMFFVCYKRCSPSFAALQKK